MDHPNVAETTPPLPPSISKLDKYLIWLILSENSDIYNPLEFKPGWTEDATEPSALDTTLATSRVCRSWRKLLLDSPFMWGRLLRLERLLKLGRKGREEIMRRTGDAPLCILGNVRTTKSAVEFFCWLLPNNWSRIQKIHVWFADTRFFKQSFWEVFLLPAPSLEWFHIEADAYDEDQLLGEDADVALFFNHAPRLRLLHPHLIYFSLREARWAVQLRSLKLGKSRMEAIEILNAIKQMPYLEHLHLEGYLGRFNQLVMPESINLPHLNNLFLHTPFHTSLTFARSIKPAKYCVLSYHILSTEEATIEDVAGIMEVLERYSEMYFPFWTVSTLELVLTGTDSFYLGVPWNGTQPQFDYLGQPYGFVADLHAAWWPQDVDSTSFFSLFLKYDLSTIKTLDFELSQSELLDIPTAWSNIAAFINLLSAVESLHVNGFALRVLNEHETDDDLYFPRLRVLGIGSLSQDSEAISAFWEFYERRARGVPIEVVDLGEDPTLDWTFLDEADGLKVIWKMDEILSEYLCGSGEPGELDFPEGG